MVLPEDSGPKISMTRPRGTPPTPSAASKEIEPVEMVEMGTTASLLPRRMMEPLPNCFSICESASSTARERSSATILLQFFGALAPEYAYFLRKMYQFEAILTLVFPGAKKKQKLS